MPARYSTTLGRSLHWVLQSFLVLTVISLLVPTPGMPVAGLDPSWVLGTNQAVAQRLAFGREIVFTYGPYASIATKAYHPAIDRLMVAASLYLALSYGLALCLITTGRSWMLKVPLWVIFTGLLLTRDALFYSYALVVGIYCYKLVDRQLGGCLNDNLSRLTTSTLFAAFGLLVLIKGSYFPLCAAITILACTLFVLEKRWPLLIAVVLPQVCTLVLFWAVSGQALSDLSGYFWSMAVTTSGYSEAMAIAGERGEIEIAYYVIAVLAILAAILFNSQLKLRSRVFVFSIFSIYLFMAFKAGFVRHDAHAVMASTSLVVGAALLVLTIPLGSPPCWLPIVMLLSAFAWKTVDDHYRKTRIDTLYSRILETYSFAWDGITKRVTQTNWLQTRYADAIQKLRAKAGIPLLEGTTDIYSAEQALLIASGNTWNPRPVFQSYAAYTPTLAEINKAHLILPTAPDNILFKIAPIDRRLPSLEDGASWIPLIERYQLKSIINGFLSLRKAESMDKSRTIERFIVEEGDFLFGETVPVPKESGLVFAELEITKTVIGKLVEVFYKPSSLEITITFENTHTKAKKYKMISGMGKAGFLLSPLIEETMEFAQLYGGLEFLEHKRVKSFSITSVDGYSTWQPAYHARFTRLAIPPSRDILRLYRLNELSVGAERQNISVAPGCRAAIDQLNGASPAPSSFSASALLHITGWLAKSVDQGVVPESVLISLRDASGRYAFVDTGKRKRPDVGRFFGKPSLRDSGFEAAADVSNIVGEYTLGLAFVEGGKIFQCPQFGVPGTFHGAPARNER